MEATGSEQSQFGAQHDRSRVRLHALVAWSLAGVLFMGALPPAGQAVQRPQAVEEDVYAAPLVNLLKFVGWPDSAFVSSESIRVCIVGAPRVAATAASLAHGRKAHGREIGIIALEEDSPALGCNALYLGTQISGDAGDLLERIGRHGLLTIGGAAGFLEAGGIVNFLRIDNRIVFEVNLDSADKAGVVVSSGLLGIAKRVLGGKRQKGGVQR